MKKIILILASIVASAAFAAITISPASRSFDAKGGGAIISTSGDGTWTAVADVDWLTVSSASGNAGKGCAYLVEANNTADVRVGHITVSGNTYTVTQEGRSVELVPASVEVGSEESSGEITITTDANVSWTVRPNDSWISVSPTTGTGPAVLTYSIQAFDGVGSRSGTITVGSQTVSVMQSGIDVNLTPTVTNVAYTVTLIPVIVDAMAETTWTVKPNDSWLSVIDPGTGRGGSQVMIAAAENPSFEKRTGTVSIGTGKITVIQEGTSDLSFKILPEVATASPLGAFGNVAVYATPDATWTAESLADWIHISSGGEGAGNGNVKYVANSNPELTPRTGQIKFTPPAFVPDVDLYRGLLFWIKDQKNIEGNEERKTTYALSKVFDGSFSNPLTGAALPVMDSDAITFSVSFKVGELDCINRLLKFADNTIYLNEGNVLSCQSLQTSFVLDEVNAYYTLVIRIDGSHNLSLYCGKKDCELTRLKINGENSYTLKAYPKMGTSYALSNFVLGCGSYPSEGNLGNGQFTNIRFWTRALTDRECECTDTKQEEMVDVRPSTEISDAKFDYFPIVGNGFGTDEASECPRCLPQTHLKGWVSVAGRTGTPNYALRGAKDSSFTLSEFSDLFEGSYETSSSIMTQGRIYYYEPIEITCSEDATYVFWLRINELPTIGQKAIVFSRQMDSLPADGDNRAFYNAEMKDHYGSTTNNFRLTLFLLPNGKLSIDQATCKLSSYSGARYDFDSTYRDTYYSFVEDSVRTSEFEDCLKTEEWVMLTLVGKARKNMTLYINDKDVGNVTTTMDFAWMPPIDMRFRGTYWGSFSGAVKKHNFALSVGGWDGDLDEMTFYNKALSAKEVKAIYEAGVVDDAVYHTVTQGIVEPTLSIDSAYMPKGGGNTNVTLTVAKGVNWTATTSDSWLSIAGDTSGSGPAEFTIKVAANPTVVERVGTVTIAGKTVTITQEGLACEVVYSNPTFSVEGDVGSITVNAENGGAWTATTDDDWIYIFSGESGTGSGEVVFITEQYLDTTSSRTGVITIGDQEVYITQRGYQLSIDPMVAEVGGNAGAGRIGVKADPDSIWTAIAKEDWITIVTGGEGIGEGSVLYTVTDNTTGQTRTGHIYISGQMYTITQTCTLKLTASVVGNGSVNGAGDYSQGKEVTLRAVPDAGNVFAHWSGDVVGNDEVTTVKMDSVKNVTATFIPEAAAQKLAEQKAAQGGFYTRDQIHALEMGNLVFDVDASGTARVGVQLMETSDLSDPNSWKPATLNGNPDVGQDGTVGMKVKAEGNAKFFKVVMPEQK